MRKALEEPGNGRVLVVDGGGSLRCALLGDNIAEMAYKNGWSVRFLFLCEYFRIILIFFWSIIDIFLGLKHLQGIIINGCIRDSEDISQMPLGVKALSTYPLKSSKRDPGLRDVPINFAGCIFRPKDWVYADLDGILVSPKELSL